MKKVVVLGGGIGGLTTGHELAQRGFQVEIYDAKKIPGGKSRTIPVAGSGTDGRPDLPGEHGFRFIPAFYRHLPDSMKRIPFEAGRTCHDNMTATSRIEIAAYGKLPVELPSRLPRSLDDFKLMWKDAFDTNVGLKEGEAEFYAERLWQVMTSCDERRLQELELQSWWDFIGAEERSDAYQKYLAEGLSRSLVAARAREGSARTVGQVQVHLMFGMLNVLAGSTDRVLDGPTSDRLLEPWIRHIESLGGSYTKRTEVTGFDCREGRIQSVTLLDRDSGESRTVTADYYVSALPVENMGPLITREMVDVDPGLGSVREISRQVAWMNGVQFFLNQDVTITRGHALYVDSPWAITSISEAQFWPSLDLANYGNGKVRGILSVDVSDWQKPGTFNKARAADLDREQIEREVWNQLKESLNVGADGLLRDEMIERVFLDTDIEMPHGDRPHREINLEPLFINKQDSWRLRPQARTAIPNLFLAADYVQTNSDLASMESANEAARRAVNSLLNDSGSDAERCAIWDMEMPTVLAPWRHHDKARFADGKPWDGRLIF